MKALIQLLVLALLITACGEKPVTGKAQVTVAGVNAALATDSNFLISALNEKTGELVRLVMTSDTLEISLPNGSWIFSAYHWDAGADLNGSLRCAQDRANLEGVDVNINLVLTRDECKNHSKDAYTDEVTGNSQKLALVFCDTNFTAGLDCQINYALVSSYKIVLSDIELSHVDQPIFGKTRITSECIVVATQGDIIDSAKVIPSGTNDAPFPFEIEAYSDASCGTSLQSFQLPQGLLTPTSGANEAYDYSIPTEDKTWLYLVVP